MLIKPLDTEFPEYYKKYIDSVPNNEILDVLDKQTTEIVNLFKGFSEEKLLFRYAQGKWSIKELLAHLLDSEIIMGYRALTYARGDRSDLPMYDHDEYVKTGSFDLIDSNILIKHYSSIRESNMLLFRSFSDKMWLQKGVTGGKSFSSRSIPYILAGHTKHHFTVLKEKYL